ncbi:MAG: baeRF10 domain-containing protein [Candidatus Caldatribacteriaceae bacterium]
MGRFIEADELLKLSSVYSQEGGILSLYYKVGGNRWEDEVAALRTIIPQRYARFGEIESFKESLHFLFKRLSHYVPSPKTRSLAIFAGMKNDFFEVYELPQPWKLTLSFGPYPYVKPLSAVLDEYRRIFLVLVDHREARFFEVYMGETREHEPYRFEVPQKVREGGWYGLDEWRITRSMENKMLHHFQEISDILLDHFRQKHFEVLFVGVRGEDYFLFERVLHSYLRERLRGRVEVGPKSGFPEILETALKVEQGVLGEEDNLLINRLVTMVGNADLATVGIANVLRAVSFGACQVLVVDESYREPGFLCASCGTMALSEGTCELCGQERGRIDNVVEEMLELVVLQKGEVKYISSSNDRLGAIQRIGAFLRFQV